jgi:hypothetical protein
MAKRKRTNIHRSIEDRYDLIPRGKEYKPFILIQDISSQGRSSRPCGNKTGRQHEFLSDLERNYFMMMEFCDDIVDIREQFPLELEKTLLIADELGIKHPIHPVTKEPITMTSDFCITLKKGYSTENIIRTTKYKQDLLDHRVIEKFTIEQTYWKRIGLDWGIVTETDINKHYSQNLDDILDYYNLSKYDGFTDIGLEEMEDIILAFLQRIIDTGKTVRQVASQFEKDIHLPKGAGIALFKHLIARRYIGVDLLSPLRMDQRVSLDLMAKSRELGEVIS